MILTYRSSLSMLICLWLAVPLVFAQRRVEVRTGEGLELRRAAYRLGVPVERVRQGRQLLERATDLLDSAAGKRSVEPLAAAWASLDREGAPRQIRRILERLRALAADSQEQGSYDILTRDASAILATAKLLYPDASFPSSENWPEPPEAGTGSPQGRAAHQPLERSRRIGRERLHRMAYQDLDEALELLAELEQGEPQADLRARVMWGLAQQGRLQEANRMLDEVLERARFLPPAERPHMEMALFYATQYRPEAMPELVSLWGEHVRSLPDSAIPSQVVEGVQLNSGEYRMLEMLAQLRRMAPQAVDESARVLPGLQQKLEAVGGMKGFSALMMEWRSAAAREQAAARRRLVDAPEGLAGLEDSSEEEILEEFWRVLGAVQEAAQRNDWKAAEQGLEVAERMLDRLDSPRSRLAAFRRLAGLHLSLNGELPEPLLNEGWDLLDEASRAKREGLFTPEDLSAGARAGVERHLDGMEEWLLAAWAWSDFEAAEANLKKRDEATRFTVSLTFVQWLTQGYRAMPRHFP